MAFFMPPTFECLLQFISMSSSRMLQLNAILFLLKREGRTQSTLPCINLQDYDYPATSANSDSVMSKDNFCCSPVNVNWIRFLSPRLTPEAISTVDANNPYSYPTK